MKDFFSFDNLGGEFALLGRDVESGLPTGVFGLSDAQKYLIASAVRGRVVYLAADALSAKRAYEALRALSGKRCALLAAKDEVLLYRKALSKDALFRRLTALYECQAGAEVMGFEVDAAYPHAPRIVPVFPPNMYAVTENCSFFGCLSESGYQNE